MGNRVLRPRFKDSDLGVNPFEYDLDIEVNEVSFWNQYKRDGDMLIPLVRDVERSPVTKLYTGSESRVLSNRLSLRAKELLLWVMYELDYGCDYLWLNKVRFMEENDISSINTYKSAVKNLIRCGYLGLTVVRDVYWINPSFFFKGDRVKKYPNRVVKLKSDTDGN